MPEHTQSHRQAAGQLLTGGFLRLKMRLSSSRGSFTYTDNDKFCDDVSHGLGCASIVNKYGCIRLE
jgi:hypothetical protein